MFLALAVSQCALWLFTLAEGYGWNITGNPTSTQWRQVRSTQRAVAWTALLLGVVGLYGLVHSVRDLVATI
jgi:hypothetical protein